MKALDARLVAQSAPSTAVTQTLAAASKPIHASAKGRAGGTGLTRVAWVVEVEVSATHLLG